MTKIFKILTIILILSSCKSIKNNLNDYSKSAYEPILLIKKETEKDTSNFNVEVINWHGSNFIINSRIIVVRDSVKIKSVMTNNFNQTKSDTIITLHKTEFINNLDKKLINAQNTLVIAGNYQEIKIQTNDSTYNFKTKKAIGLMNLLKTGK